ncbi:MAG: Ig-like domain-containing protein [Pseudomarimonas sp.]
MRKLISVAWVLAGGLASLAVNAQNFDYHVYLNSDSRSLTGCTVIAADGQSFSGIDHRLTATVAGSPPIVTELRLAGCAGGDFATGAVIGGNYPVGLNNGVALGGGAFADVIELSLSRQAIAGATLITIGFGAQDGAVIDDGVFTRNGLPGGSPMTIGTVLAIPTAGFVGLLLLGTLLLVLGGLAMRRNGRLTRVLLVSACLVFSAAAWAANFVLDGEVGDWSGTTPLATDQAGDSPLSGTDIVAAFALDEDPDLRFRIDVVDAENRPPVAVDDAYTVLEDQTLTVPAPGVLANDSDPDANALSAEGFTLPNFGVLDAETDGSFTFTGLADENGAATFSYFAFDGQVASMTPATVTVTVTAVNDAPSFTATNPPAVNEDAGVQSLAFATFSAGPANESGQSVLDYTVSSVSNAGLFAAGPTIANDGTLSYTPAPDANGSSQLAVVVRDNGGTANGGIDTSAPQTFTITVNAVNDTPTFVAGPNQSINEDAAAQTAVGWAAAINDGDPELTQTLTFLPTVTNTTSNLAFTTPPTINATTGTLTYAVAPNTNGVATIEVRLQDNGSNVAPNVNISAPQTFTITVSGINDAPSFTAGPNQTVNEDAGAQAVTPWATAINDGDPEVTQALAFAVTNNTNTALFSAGPAVSPTGVLTYTPAANANGVATITLRLDDDGGTANGGVNQSPTQTFTITVNAINDAPGFMAGPNQSVTEDAGAQTVTPWATGINAGPLDEAGQTLTFNITANTNAALFSAAPAVSPAGALTYTPAADASGVATITLTLSDDGPGAPPPNANTSAAQTFTITVNAVNDAPVNTVPGAQTTGDGTSLVFSTANTNAISIVDFDAAAGIVQVSFGTGAAANGALTLANPGGALTTLTGNGTEQVTATGTLTALNAALNGPGGSLTYTPVGGTSAARTITMITNDQGNSGAGGAQSDTDTITVNVDGAPIASSTPANGATIANNAPISVNFDEPVNVTAGITLNCGGPITLTGTTGSNVTSLPLGYTAPLPAGTCTLTVPAASVQDVDTIDPPNNPTGNFAATFTVDAAPVLVSSTPAAAAVVNTGQTVSFTYSEAVTNAGSAITLNCGGAIAGAISGSGTTTLTFTPTNPLAAGASCTATAVAAQINDADAFDPPQNPVANSTINFTVDAAPAFVSSVPAANGTVVGTTQVVSFTFDESVANLGSAITLNCGAAVTGAITGGGTPTLTFTPTNPLTAGASCTATAVAAQIGDSDSIDPPQNPVANVVRTFTVDVAPTVSSTNPANGAIDVGLNTDLIVNFSEAVTFAAGAFTLNCPAGSPIPFTVSGSGTTQASIDPSANLPINTLCVLTVDAALVQDVDSADPPDVGSGITTVNFTTVNDNPPTVTASVPAPGATVANNQALSISFSEAIVATAGSVTLTCGGPNLITGGAAGSNVTTLTPIYTAPLPSGACTLTVLAANITDFDAIDPPDLMVANYVANFTVDAAPALVSSTPAAAAVVNTGQTVSFTYSEAVTNVGSAITLNCGGAIAGAISGSGTTTLTFTPTNPLAAGASCTATAVAAQINDADAFDPPQNPVANSTINFTVDAAPAFVSATPAAAAVVGTGQTVSFTFDENVANLGGAITLNCGGAVAGAISGSGSTTLTFTPTAPLTAGTSCMATAVASQIGDVDIVDPPQNPVADVIRNFTVDVAPDFSASVPVNNAINVGLSANITVTFTEAVNFTASAFTLNCPAGSPIPFTVSGSGSNTATIDPTPPTLPINTLCVLTVDDALVTDFDAADPPNAGTGITTISFTTVNDNAPMVSSVMPANGATTSSTFTLNLLFSEPVVIAANAITIACSPSGAGLSSPSIATAPTNAIGVNGPPTGMGQPGDTCTVTVQSALVTDADVIDPPNQLDGDGSGDTIDGDADNFVSTYIVDAAPIATTTVPANGATDIAIAAGSITVNFSESVTVTPGGITLTCPANVPLTGLPVTGTSVTLTHSGLPGGATCTITVLAANVTDTDSFDPPQNPTAAFTSSFTTADAAPEVLTTTPANGATDVNPSSTITVTFSESVNFSTAANAANTSFDLECPAGSPADFTVTTASPATSVVLNPVDNAIAGATCSFIVRAAGITDADLIDPPNTMAADFSASFSFGALAENDAYTVTPHLTLGIGTGSPQGGGVLANDLIGGGSVTGFGFAPTCTGTAPGNQLDAGAANGRLTLNANGSFGYEPPAGVANATRTFCYTVTGGDTANIAFTIQNTELVWFVNAAAAGGGIGTQARPFQTLVAASTVDTANDTIYLAFNASAYTNGISLEAGERLIGEASGSDLTTITGIVPVAGSTFPALGGSAPTITCAGLNCLTLATGNTLRGFTVGDSGATGTDIVGSSFGTATVAEVSLTGNGRALNLTSGTLNGNFLDINVSASTTTGISLASVSGTWSVTNAVDIVAPSGITALTTSGAITFAGGVNVTAATGNGINISNNSAAWGLGNVVSSAATNGLRVVGGGSVTASGGTLTATNGTVLNLQGVAATITLAGAAATPGGGIGMSIDSITGTVAIGNGGDIAGASSDSVDMIGTLGTFSYGGNIIKPDGGRLIEISAGTSGNVTFSGELSCAACGNAFSGGILVTNRSGGTYTFSGSSKALTTGIRNGVDLTSNTGATINFSGGGLAVTTTSGTGFNATGGGTVSVQGTANTLATSTGTALSVANTNIGASGLNFRSISANGGTNGIVLNTTGGAGGLTVSGNSGGLCGGSVGSGPPATAAAVVAPVVADCTGGTIQNTSGPGLVLTNTSAVSLTRMRIINSGDDGIQGTNVTGFSLISSLLDNNGNAINESGMDFGDTTSITPDGLHGTGGITNSTVQNSYYNGLSIRNNGGTALTSFAVTGSQFRANAANGDANDNLFIEAGGTANMAMAVSGSLFASTEGDHIQAAALNAGSVNVGITNNTLTGGHSTPLGQGITINAATGVAFGGWTGRIDYDVNGNNITGAVSNGVSAVLGTSAVSAVFDGFIRNNVIGTSGVALSCSTQGAGAYVDSRGNGTHNASVTGNTIRQCSDRGILSEAGDGDSVLNLTIQTNIIDQQVGALAREAFQTNYGITPTNVFSNVDSPQICLQLGGAGGLANTFSHGAGAPDDFRLRNRFEAVVRMPGYGGAEDDTAAVVAYIQGRNSGSAGEPGSATASATAGAGYFNTPGGAACALPTL